MIYRATGLIQGISSVHDVYDVCSESKLKDVETPDVTLHKLKFKKHNKMKDEMLKSVRSLIWELVSTEKTAMAEKKTPILCKTGYHSVITQETRKIEHQGLKEEGCCSSATFCYY
ncbi:hypothetical protein AVEN_229460-1 [Araneus ventricosus]|uniref:Uncharacterized protein n=1 Tax=Araneus ventricosus TaxID=182803 RepID=A0A4Y2JK96_ARAVE|nr:hypothetical protein AVEN_229460-1 [Araneus ventricosus]